MKRVWLGYQHFSSGIRLWPYRRSKNLSERAHTFSCFWHHSAVLLALHFDRPGAVCTAAVPLYAGHFLAWRQPFWARGRLGAKDELHELAATFWTISAKANILWICSCERKVRSRRRFLCLRDRLSLGSRAENSGTLLRQLGYPFFGRRHLDRVNEKGYGGEWGDGSWSPNQRSCCFKQRGQKAVWSQEGNDISLSPRLSTTLTVFVDLQWNAVALWAWGEWNLCFTALTLSLVSWIWAQANFAFVVSLDLLDIVVDNCAICRNHIMDLCTYKCVWQWVLLWCHVMTSDSSPHFFRFSCWPQA